MSKYHAQKTEVDGITFASKKEAARYGELKLLLQAGEILDLRLQPKFLLQDGFTDVAGKYWHPIHYIADFEYYDNQRRAWIIEDTKGVKTKEFRLKEKLFRYQYRDRVLEVG